MIATMQDPSAVTLDRATRHVSSTGVIYYTVLAESDPTGEGRPPIKYVLE